MAVSQLRFRKHVLPAAAALLLGASFAASADDGEAASPFKLSGFATIVAGKTIGSSTLAPDYIGPASLGGRECPCWIADWTNGGIYGDDLSFKPESRAGVQASYRFSKKLNFVTQIVVRGTEPKPSLQWAYGSYEIDNNWEFQFGRKRLPLYYYSDFQDVGAAYPWIGVPPEVYGWEVTNYDGASLRYKGKLGATSVMASVFGGKGKVKDSPYHGLYYEGETDVTWRNIVGADLEASRGPLTVRATYFQAQTASRNALIGMDDSARMRGIGVAANLDFDDWFVLSELTKVTRDYGYIKTEAPEFTIGAGYRWNNWTPFVNYSRYRDYNNDESVWAPTIYRRMGFTLRYDIDARNSLKAQFDRAEDTSRNYGDNSKVFRVSYDVLF